MTASSENQQAFSAAELSRIIEMAWEDRTPFDCLLYTSDAADE